jgi:acyl-CoA hydrolase
VRQRAKELINIAHPRFRDELKAAGRELGYL